MKIENEPDTDKILSEMYGKEMADIGKELAELGKEFTGTISHQKLLSFLKALRIEFSNMIEKNDKLIKFYEENIKKLESNKNSDVIALRQKEIKLIELVKKESLWLHSGISFFESSEKMIQFMHEDILSYPEKIHKAKIEIDSSINILLAKGLIKGDLIEQ